MRRIVRLQVRFYDKPSSTTILQLMCIMAWVPSLHINTTNVIFNFEALHFFSIVIFWFALLFVDFWVWEIDIKEVGLLSLFSKLTHIFLNFAFLHLTSNKFFEICFPVCSNLKLILCPELNTSISQTHCLVFIIYLLYLGLTRVTFSSGNDETKYNQLSERLDNIEG